MDNVQRASRGRFQTRFARYQQAQERVEQEGEQLANSQAAMNRAMGSYVSQQLAESGPAPPVQPLPGTSGMLVGSMHPGLSSTDASPVFPKKFEDQLAKSRRRLIKLKRILARTSKGEDKVVSRSDALKNFFQEELQGVRDAVLEANERLTDDINAGYHQVAGPRGPPGLSGLRGHDGEHLSPLVVILSSSSFSPPPFILPHPSIAHRPSPLAPPGTPHLFLTCPPFSLLPSRRRQWPRWREWRRRPPWCPWRAWTSRSLGKDRPGGAEGTSRPSRVCRQAGARGRDRRAGAVG